jgi:hypothetical protein
VVDKRAHVDTAALSPWAWHDDDAPGMAWSPWNADLEATLTSLRIAFQTEEVQPSPTETRKQQQFDAVKRWFEDDWMRIDPKLRTSIVEGISVFLSLFDDNPDVKHTFCPPKTLYDPTANPDGRQGTALPPMAQLIEQGKVIALNFPVAMKPRACSGDRHDAETGRSARRVESHSSDECRAPHSRAASVVPV